MKRGLVCVFAALLLFTIVGFAEATDCGCAAPADAAKECIDAKADELLQMETQGMEWQCIYWWECVHYDTAPCDPCYSACMLGCIPVCAAGGFWWGVGCGVGCPLICLIGCGECEYCDEWEQQHSCGWVFTE